MPLKNPSNMLFLFTAVVMLKHEIGFFFGILFKLDKKKNVQIVLLIFFVTEWNELDFFP